MLMIRFQRIGRRNDPAFRIVVLERERAAQAGNIVEQIGTYNPRSKALTLAEERAKHWLSMGAQPTDSIRNLFITRSVLTGTKVNVLPKKTPFKKEQETEKEVQTVAPTSESESAPETPTETEVAAEVVEPIAETPAIEKATVADGESAQ